MKTKRTIDQVVEDLEKSANEAWEKNVIEKPEIFKSMSKYPFIYGWVTQGIKSYFRNKSV